jgi:hypothetical protein
MSKTAKRPHQRPTSARNHSVPKGYFLRLHHVQKPQVSPPGRGAFFASTRRKQQLDMSHAARITCRQRCWRRKIEPKIKAKVCEFPVGHRGRLAATIYRRPPGLKGMETAPNLVADKSTGSRPVDSPAVASRKGRSKVTNGKVLIAGVDQRSPWVRRAKDVIAAHLADLGGEVNTSAAERSIVRRAGVLTVELERLEARFATAGEASTDDLETYQRCANSLRRLLEAVGLQRRARDLTLSLGQILRQSVNND